MPELMLRNLDNSVWTMLRRKAAEHGQSPEAEAEAILARALDADEAEVWAGVDAIRDRLAASGRDFGDSAELLAEDRHR
jgi:plasmid stability protein